MTQNIMLDICLAVFSAGVAMTLADVWRRTRTTIDFRVGNHNYRISGRSTSADVGAIFDEVLRDRTKHARRQKLS